jgi:hypothetical protein
MSKIFSKISLFFFKEIVKMFEPKLSGMKRNLENANINQDVVTYLSNTLFISFLFFIVFEFLIIFLLIFLRIYFDFISFLVTIFISMSFTIIFFMMFYKYPQYIIMAKRQKMEKEIQKSIKHLQALKDPEMTVKDVLLILQKIEYNDLLTKESKKVLSMSNLNQNLRNTLEYVGNRTYSEIESEFFRKLRNVLDKKESLQTVLDEFLQNVEQNIKEEKEQRKSKATLLFAVNVFLFLIVFVFLSGVFFVSLKGPMIRQILMAIAFIFPIIEIILIIILGK